MIIGIGADTDREKVCRSIRSLDEEINVRCYTSAPLPDIMIRTEISDHPERALIDDLFSGRINAAVRGSLPASTTLRYLKEKAGVDHLERIALLQDAKGRQFLLAPVGVDEGWTVSDRIALIKNARRIAHRFGLSEKTAVLSGGRFGDLGRHPVVDRSLADAELIAHLTGADHTEIRIEDAIEDHGILIAPEGITGNLIFRTLTFLGDGAANGAPVVNINKIFVDTSRASADYSNAILLAASLTDL